MADSNHKRFDQLVAEGRALLQGHQAAQTGIDHQRWYEAVGEFIQSVEPGSALNAKWASSGTSPLLSEGYYYDTPEAWARHKAIVQQQLKFLGDKVAPLLQKPRTPDSIWSLLHPKIVEIAKPRYESKHFADAVEAALKHVNEQVKGIVRTKTGQELDGASLMKHAFSPNKPVIIIEDMTTETGKNMQLGYMEIFSGAMTGIRNPKAHANLTITPETAIHHLFLASLLMYRVEGRQNP